VKAAKKLNFLLGRGCSLWNSVTTAPGNWFRLLVLLVVWPTAELRADAVEFELITVAPGVYLHPGRHEDMDAANRGDIANIGFIVGGQSVLVIDPGGSPAVARHLREAIRTVTDLPVSHVVLTHIHPDHVLGSGVFDDSGQMIAHENYPRSLAQRGDFYLERFNFLFGSDAPALPVPDVLVDSAMEVDLGNRRVVITAHPTAHTDNDLSVYDINSGTLWASDLVFAGRVPVLDGSLKGWIEVTENFLAGSAKTVIPGHGKPGTLQSTIAPQLRYLRKILDQTREHVSNDARLTTAVETVAKDEENQWLLFSLYHKGNVTRAFTELEWE